MGMEMIHPDKPNHPKQKYRLTEKGLALKETFSNTLEEEMMTLMERWEELSEELKDTSIDHFLAFEKLNKSF